MIKPIPDGYSTLTPFVAFKDSLKAIAFYKKAFGATENYVTPGPRGKGVMHAELKIGNSIVMLGDEAPERGCLGVESYKGSPVAFYVYVTDADSAFKKAVAAGAATLMPVEDAFWGDRVGTVKDPFGLQWSFATHKKDLSQEEIRKGAEEFLAQKH